MREKVRIGIAEMRLGRAPEILITYGLGSCLGITLYDPQIKMGAMAHTLLPTPRPDRQESRPAKFAESAIVTMKSELVSLGAQSERLIAKLIGGANMFENLYPMAREQVGDRNVQVARETLENLGIPLVAEDTGGNYGRTAELHLETGELQVRSIKGREKIFIL